MKECTKGDTWKHLEGSWIITVLPVDQTVKNLPAVLETWVRSLDWKDPPGEGNGYPLQYSCLGNSMDREAWRAIVQGVAKSQTRLSD